MESLACLGGALMIASGDVMHGGPSYGWVAQRIGLISNWNDHPSRTHNQVIEKLDSLIEERIEEITHETRNLR